MGRSQEGALTLIRTPLALPSIRQTLIVAWIALGTFVVAVQPAEGETV